MEGASSGASNYERKKKMEKKTLASQTGIILSLSRFCLESFGICATFFWCLCHLFWKLFQPANCQHPLLYTMLCSQRGPSCGLCPVQLLRRVYYSWAQTLLSLLSCASCFISCLLGIKPTHRILQRPWNNDQHNNFGMDFPHQSHLTRTVKRKVYLACSVS
jgi:hypothetical protein